MVTLSLNTTTEDTGLPVLGDYALPPPPMFLIDVFLLHLSSGVQKHSARLLGV